MIQLPEDRRPPLSPQLALRVAVIGSFALAMFAIIFFLLWFLQVLSGDQYLAQASQNRTRDISIPAQRGEILDRNGTLLVDSRSAWAVQVAVPDLPRSAARRDAMLHRLAGVLGISTRPLRCHVPVPGGPGRRPAVVVQRLPKIECDIAQQHAVLPYANVTVQKDVPQPVLWYLSERQQEFPGVLEPQVFVRHYPLGTLAAQLLGTVGPISSSELHDPRYRGVPNDAIVGQTGIERSYDRYLRGHDGAYRVEVNSLGGFTGYLRQSRPVGGHNLRLSVDLNLQKAAEASLAQSIGSNPPADAGAFVVLNPTDGEVLALGSNPTYDPNVFAKPFISQSEYNQLFGPGSGAPQVNRAISGIYPTGSTFKAITAIAALQSGKWNAGSTYDDTGVFNLGAQVRYNAGHAAFGSLDLVNAIRVSSDIFFYNLGALMNEDPSTHPWGGPLQEWARKFGIGRPSGIDLAGEEHGILPSPRWREQNNALELAYERKHHVPCCTLGDLRPWSIGDNVSLAVGQGDLEASPLQLAVAYAAIENGGTIVRPHVGLQVEAADGTVLQKIDPPPARHIAVEPANLDTVRAGLRAAASQPGGTSADVFAGFPAPVYGKTGTAQHANQQDQAWYVCFVPAWHGKPPVLVAVTVEQGGFGAVAAAPVARQILSEYYFGNRGPFVAGASRTL
jgi:penicillin-binding protein 2